MTADEAHKLQPGDTIRHYLSGDIWTVTDVDPIRGHITAARTVTIGDPRQLSEWNVVPRPRRRGEKEAKL